MTSFARMIAESIVTQWWEGASTSDEWMRDAKMVEMGIESAIAEEREACAQTCEAVRDCYEANAFVPTTDGRDLARAGGAQACAEVVRARKQVSTSDQGCPKPEDR